MSAGGISYSGVVGNRKVTLPSVESWGTNMNIMKDPPKSIFTRKIDKVSDTQEFQRMVESSIEDRQCENLQVYPRGVNPSVAVSYSNYGNNGGKLMHFGKDSVATTSVARDGVYGGDGYQQAVQNKQTKNSGQISNGHTMTKYPYRIDLDGDFRPPASIFPETRLAALSRLPRNVTNVYTNPLAGKWLDRSTCDSKQYDRATRPDIFSVSATATSCHQIGAVASANNRTMCGGSVQKSIHENMLNTTAHVNKTENIHVGTAHDASNRGIRDIESTMAVTSKTTNIHGKDGAEAHQINTAQFIATPINIDVHTKFTELAALDLSSMRDNNVRTRDITNMNVMTNKQQHRTGTLANESVAVKIKDIANKTVNTNYQGEYNRNNVNYDLQKLERNTPGTSGYSNHSGDYTKHHIIDPNVKLERRQNQTPAYTNLHNNREEHQHNRVRGARLHPTLSVQEGFEGRGTQPVSQTTNIDYNLAHNNRGVNKDAYNLYADRFQDASTNIANRAPI